MTSMYIIISVAFRPAQAVSESIPGIRWISKGSYFEKGGQRKPIAVSLQVRLAIDNHTEP